jgi:hypothetical protein
MMTSKALPSTAAAVCIGIAACGTAAADPTFPDLNSFSAVDPGPYQAHGRGTTSLLFDTPDGLSCSFGSARDMADPDADQHLSCTGKFPARPSPAPPRNDQCALERIDDANGLIYHFSSSYTWGPCDAWPNVRPLGAAQKLSSGSITCAVGAGDLTACLDTRAGQRHGFVLQPSGSVGF